MHVQLDGRALPPYTITRVLAAPIAVTNINNYRVLNRQQQMNQITPQKQQQQAH